MKRERVKRWHRFAAVGLIGFLIAGAGIVFSVQPTLAALVCPRCFGFEQLSGGVFVDAAMPGPLRAQLASAMREGETKVADFYGELRATPEVLACATDSCWRGLEAVAHKVSAMRASGFVLHHLASIPSSSRMNFRTSNCMNGLAL